MLLKLGLDWLVWLRLIDISNYSWTGLIVSISQSKRLDGKRLEPNPWPSQANPMLNSSVVSSLKILKYLHLKILEQYDSYEVTEENDK